MEGGDQRVGHYKEGQAGIAASFQSPEPTDDQESRGERTPGPSSFL